MSEQSPTRDHGKIDPNGARRNSPPAGLRITMVAIGVAALAGCTKPAPEPIPLPPPPPPPPPVVETVPYRPLPPSGASYVMNIPPLGLDGKRLTINRNLDDDETVWHFRSGWNVAALNCTAPQYAPINEAYTAFVNDHQRALEKVNDRLESRYRQQEGSRRGAIIAREAKLTSTYNFFALPPARGGFCRTMLELSNRALATPPSDPAVFALSNFSFIETPFDAFFLEYEEYERNSSAWDVKYGDIYGPSQPGWVAVQAARANGNPNVPTVGDTNPASTLSPIARPAGSVADPDTGVGVPIIPVEEGFISQPVVEPVTSDPTDGTTGVPPGDTEGQSDSPQ